jgi:homoserine kinase
MKQGTTFSEVFAIVPASVANLGPGFDVLSIALQKPMIEVALARAPRGSHTIYFTGPYAKEVTVKTALHAGAKALETLHKQFGKPDAYTLRIRVEIPPRKGLGLSGAEAVGAVLCANRLFKLGLDRESVAHIAATAEPSHHMDNVAASALGGFNIITRTPLAERSEITTFRPPTDLGVAVVVPNIEKASTEPTRQVLPATVATEQYVRSMSYVARISAAFASSDVNAIIETLQWDPMVEPARADAGCYGKGIDAHFLQEEKEMLLREFHVAETISGAGPSRALWYSISEDRRVRKKKQRDLIQVAIEQVSSRLRSLGHDVREVYITKPSAKGAAIVPRGKARA